jgi:hypothetical protein
MLGSYQDRGVRMIRKLSIAVLAAAALSGCVSSGYGYRGGAGDYYYGQSLPGQYGYGAPYGSVGYGHPGGVYGSISYGTRYYRSPYGYGYGLPYYGRGYGYPYVYRPGYGYFAPYHPPYRTVVVRPPHQHQPHPPPRERPDHSDVPWRDLDRLRERKSGPPRPMPARSEMAHSAGVAIDNPGTWPRGDASAGPARRVGLPQVERPSPRSRGVNLQEETP